MRAHSLGVPSVLEDTWGPGCVRLRVLPGAKAPWDGVTIRWNRVDIVPNVQKCPVPGCAVLTEVSGTGSDVVPNVPKYPVPVLRPYRTCRNVRHRY